MSYELIYIDSKTETKNINKFIHNRNIIFDYNTIRRSNDRYGIFLADGDEIVGVAEVTQEDEDGESFSNIDGIHLSKPRERRASNISSPNKPLVNRDLFYYKN